jgi:hypothetical protein
MLEDPACGATTLQIIPVHERPKIRVALGAGDLKRTSQLVTVVNLSAARREKQASGGVQRILAVSIVRRSVIVGAEIVQHTDPAQCPCIDHAGIPGEETVPRSGVTFEAEVDESVVSVGEEVHCPVTEVIQSAVADFPSIDLTHHVEGKGVQLRFRVPPAPGGESIFGLSLQLHADGRLEVFRRIDPVAVEPELPDPIGEPLNEIVARSAGIPGAAKEGVELLDFLLPTSFAGPLLQQGRR